MLNSDMHLSSEPGHIASFKPWRDKITARKQSHFSLLLGALDGSRTSKTVVPVDYVS